MVAIAADCRPWRQRREEINRLTVALRAGGEVGNRAAAELVLIYRRLLGRRVTRYGTALGLPRRAWASMGLYEAAARGLLDAAARFDPDRGVQLATVAVYWIDRHLREAIAAEWGAAVRIPLWAMWRQPETVPDRLRSRVAAAKAAPASWIDAAGEGGQPPTGWTPPEEQPDRLAEAEESAAIVRTEVAAALTRLAGRNRRAAFIVARRFGLDGGDPQSLQQIGDQLGLTRERVRQIQDEALAYLSTYLRKAAEHVA